MQLKCKCLEVLACYIKFLLNRNCLKVIYYGFILRHLNFANISCTNPNKLNTLHNKQKHAARIIFIEDRMTHRRPLTIKYIKRVRLVYLQNTNFHS